VVVTACLVAGRKPLPGLQTVREAQIALASGTHEEAAAADATSATSLTSDEAVTVADAAPNAVAATTCGSTEVINDYRANGFVLVDTIGLALDPRDGLHLLRAAQLKLGQAIAYALAAHEEKAGRAAMAANRGVAQGAHSSYAALEQETALAALMSGGHHAQATKTGTATTAWSGGSWRWATRPLTSPQSSPLESSITEATPTVASATAALTALQDSYNAVATMPYDDVLTWADRHVPPAPRAEAANTANSRSALPSNTLQSPPPKNILAATPPQVPEKDSGYETNKGDAPSRDDLGAQLPQAQVEKKPFALFSGNSERPKMVNFVYGEILPSSMAVVLEAMAPKPGETFVDLGSGAGKTVLLAALLYPELNRCVGLEMMRGYLRDAQAASAVLVATGQGNISMEGEAGEGDKLTECSSAAASVANGIASAPVEWWEGDFLSPTGMLAWASASLIVACSTCFDATTMAGIADSCARNSPAGARVLTLDKPLPTLRAQVCL